MVHSTIESEEILAGEADGNSRRAEEFPHDLSRRQRRLNVMLATGSLHFGGAERQVVELARSLDRTRFNPVLCCLDGTRTLFDANPSDTPLEMVVRGSRFDLGIFPRMGRALRKYRVDVLHCFLFDSEIIGRVVGRCVGLPAVIGSERNSDYPSRPVKDTILRLTRPLVDLVIANSNAGKNYSCGHLHFPRNRVAVVHNCVDTARFYPRNREEIRARLNIPHDCHLIGMFASFKQQKNHAMFFRTAKRILQRHPNARFLCVSHVPLNDRAAAEYQASLCRLLTELQIEPAMIMLINRSDVEELYNACDMTVLTSRREGTPNVVLESMASGVPVIATDVADNALIIPGGSAGGVVPLDDDAGMADQVCAMLENPEARRAAGRMVRAHVMEHFTVEAWADKFGRLYEETFERKMRERCGRVR